MSLSFILLYAVPVAVGLLLVGIILSLEGLTK